MLGEVVGGLASFSWRPLQKTFDTALVTYSNLNLSDFVDFLKFLGANAQYSFFNLGSYMPNDFLLCDGLNMMYTLKLTGEKHFLMHEEDQTALKLNY